MVEGKTILKSIPRIYAGKVRVEQTNDRKVKGNRRRGHRDDIGYRW